MEGYFVKSQSVFSLHLDGSSTVDADIVVQAIHNMSIITSEISKAEDPQLVSKLQVQPFRNGSFEILFITIAELGISVINDPYTAAKMAQKVVEILFKCFEIKKHLKGEQPKSITYNGDYAKIENRDGNIINAPKASTIVINNITVNNAVSDIARYASKNNPNGGFTMSCQDNSEISLNFSPEDVHSIASGSSIITEYQKKCSITEENLLIKSLSFIGKSKWSFIMRNKTIQASIEDDEWLEKVQNGSININAKDCIHVQLEITTDLDSLGFPILGSEKYTVLKVLELFPNYYDIDRNQISL